MYTEKPIQTKVLQISDITRGAARIDLAARVLREGGLVAFPTETVYGIGANAMDPDAVARIFQAKGRPQDNPLIVHIAELEQLDPLVREAPEPARALARVYWPGPLTMVLPRSGIVPDIVSAGLDTVAVRMPSLPLARELIRRSGVPVAAPSANRSGRPSPTTAGHCIADLDGRVEVILDGGPCPVGVESTVISLAGEGPRLLRPGAVTLAQLEQVLGKVWVDPAVLHHLEDDAKVSSPGMKYKHYAPKAQIVLVSGPVDEFAAFMDAHGSKGTYALVFDEDLDKVPPPCLSYGPERDSEAQARALFAVLRRLDDLGATKVYARTPAKSDVGMAVYNRLVRAAAFTEIVL